MSHSHDVGSGDIHTHVHTDKCPEELSAKYTEYIESHLEDLKTQCDHINTCLNELLEDVNPIQVLNGYDLSLNKTCSLVYKSDSETFDSFTSKCTPKERDDIRSDIELHLNKKLTGTPDKSWTPVKKCLTNKYGDKDRTTFVDKLCGLAHNKTRICPSFDVHETVQVFFNDQIHHLRCTCRTLQHGEAGHGSLPLVIGAAAGGVFLLLVLLVVGCMYCRWRKSQKRKKKSANVIYLPPPNVDSCPIYTEIFDNKGYEIPSAVPPALPMRFTENPSQGSKLKITNQENDPTYLEPVVAGSGLRPTLSVPSKENPGYGLPPEYREAEDEDGSEESVQSQEPKPIDVLLGPVPVKRTKKDDRQAESVYFILEQNEEGQKESS